MLKGNEDHSQQENPCSKLWAEMEIVGVNADRGSLPGAVDRRRWPLAVGNSSGYRAVPRQQPWSRFQMPAKGTMYFLRLDPGRDIFLEEQKALYILHVVSSDVTQLHVISQTIAVMELFIIRKRARSSACNKHRHPNGCVKRTFNGENYNISTSCYSFLKTCQQSELWNLSVVPWSSASNTYVFINL